MIPNLLVTQFNNFKVALRRMHSSATFRPFDHSQIFSSKYNKNTGLGKLEIGPVVFKFPEKQSDMSCDLFIVISGFLKYSLQSSNNQEYFHTHNFGSEIGYFRHKNEKLSHVFGAHYDFEETLPGHPVFHAQFKSFSEFSEEIRKKFHINSPLVDLLEGMLSNVRVPCAQMDVFSLFLQICADHLINEKSNSVERNAFKDLLEDNRFLKGAGLPLHSDPNSISSCLRSRHWYIP